MGGKLITRREFLKSSAIAASGIALAACAPTPTPLPEPTAAPAAAAFDWKKHAGTEITYNGVKADFSDVTTDHVDGFEALTGIKLNMDLSPGGEVQKKLILAMTTTPDKVDVLYNPVANFKYKAYADRWFDDLYPYLNDPSVTDPDFDFDDILRPVVGSCSSKDGDKLWGMPFWNFPYVWAYRKDVYEEKGLQPPTTLEELKNNIAACHDPDNELFGLSARGVGWLAIHPFIYFLRAFGASWVDEDGNANLNTPEFLQAVEFYGGLLRDYGPPGATDLDDAKSVALFGQGNAAHYYGISRNHVNWCDPEKSTIVGKTGWFGALKESPELLGETALAISRQSKNKEAAWQFIQWFVNKENQLRMQLAGHTSVRRSAWESPEFKSGLDPCLADLMPVVRENLENGMGGEYPPAEDLLAAREAIGVAITVTIQGGDVETVVAKVNEDYQSLLDQAGGAPTEW